MTQRVVIVTGSSGGIGAAIVRRFHSDGHRVVGLDILEGHDVSDPAACVAACDAIVAEHGRIDVLCNNAGTSAVGDVVVASPEEWQRVFDVNVFGVANMSRAALPHMRVAGGGVVVNTCSVAASVGLVERAVYSASKGAVLALTPPWPWTRSPLGSGSTACRRAQSPAPGWSDWWRQHQIRGDRRTAPPPPAPRPPGRGGGGGRHGRLPGRRHDLHDRSRCPARRWHHGRASGGLRHSP